MERVTTLGQGVLAAAYVAGSGTMRVTPAVWPNGLAFPSASTFSVRLRSGPGPKYPVYTVSNVVDDGDDRVFTVAIEDADMDDLDADAGVSVAEVQSARSLLALVNQVPSGGPTYKYFYVIGGVVNTNGVFSGGLNAVLINALAVNSPTGAAAKGPGLTENSAGGAVSVFPVRIPPTWDGSAITLDIDGVFGIDVAAGTGIFECFSAALAPGDNANVVTWSAASAQDTVTAGGTSFPVFPLSQWSLSLPLTGLVAGGLVYVAVVRVADTFAGPIYIIGISVGIKY